MSRTYSYTAFILLAHFAGLVTLLVGLIVQVLLGFLVMIVQKPAGCAGDSANSQP